jgi:hypothetical protein
MPRYFVVAKGTKALPYAGNYPWPYEVSVCFEEVAKPIGWAVGVGHGNAGTLLSAAEALEPHWREHFASAQGEWLLPLLERLAAGGRLDQKEVLRIASANLGQEPGFHDVEGARGT